MDYETLSTINELLTNAYIAAKIDNQKSRSAYIQHCLSNPNTTNEDNPYYFSAEEAKEKYERYAHAYFGFCDVAWGCLGAKERKDI